MEPVNAGTVYYSRELSTANSQCATNWREAEHNLINSHIQLLECSE